MYDQGRMRKPDRHPNTRQSLSKDQIFLLVSIVMLIASLVGGGIILLRIYPKFAPVGSIVGSPTSSAATRIGTTVTPISSTPTATATQTQPSPSPTQIVNQPNLLHSTFTLDNVTVSIASPFLPGTFSASDNTATKTYVATASGPQQYKDSNGQQVRPVGAIDITAVPYGTEPTTEGVPIAQPGGAQAYRDFLYHYRTSEGDTPQSGPTSTLFGQQVQSIASLMHGPTTVAYSSTVVVEWVVEAGKRIWIIRITEEQPLGTVDLTPAKSFLAALQDLTLSSDTLSNPA